MNPLLTSLHAVDLESEAALLGALLAHPEIIPRILPRIKPGFIKDDRHLLVLKAIQTLYARRIPVSPETVREYLTAEGWLNDQEPDDSPEAYQALVLMAGFGLAAQDHRQPEEEHLLDKLVCDACSPEFASYYLHRLETCAHRRCFVGLALKTLHLVSKHQEDHNTLALEVERYFKAVITEYRASSSPAPRTVWSAVALASEPAESSPWLLDKLLIQGGINLLAGEVSSGKTFLALDLALGVAADGKAWGGRKSAQGPVLYFCLDSPRQTVRKRLHALCLGRRVDPPESLFFDFSYLNLGDQAAIAEVGRRIDNRHAKLVIFDALARYIPGVDENTVATIGPVMTNLRRLAERTGCALLLVHHFNKGSTYRNRAFQSVRVRGSTDIIAAADTVITLSITGTRSSPRRILTPEKNRDLPEQPSVRYDISPSPDGGLFLEFHTLSPDNSSSTLTQQLLEACHSLLQDRPGIPISRSNLNDCLKEIGFQFNIRTLDRVLVTLKENPNIRISRNGNLRSYIWLPPECEKQLTTSN